MYTGRKLMIEILVAEDDEMIANLIKINLDLNAKLTSGLLFLFSFCRTNFWFRHFLPI